jgi:hypothetical protein
MPVPSAQGVLNHAEYQREVWFSILQGQSLSGTSFTSIKQLQDHIDAYVNAYNDRAEPFVWTKERGPSTPVQRPPYHSALIPATSTAQGDPPLSE